jgi:hypothetical protein
MANPTYYAKHKKEKIEYDKRYRKINKEKIKIRNQRYVKEHRKEINARRRKYNERHREEVNVKAREYHMKNKVKENFQDKRRKYGLTFEQIDALLIQQDHKCAICGKELKETNRHIDHDHLNKRVRGILCNKCNLGLGLFNDNIELTKKASEYLIRHLLIREE